MTLDAASQPENAAAWINWFVSRNLSEYKKRFAEIGTDETLAVLPDRDANTAFFMGILTGKSIKDVRVWDADTAFTLSSLLSGLLELDISKRMTLHRFDELAFAGWKYDQPCFTGPGQ